MPPPSDSYANQMGPLLSYVSLKDSRGGASGLCERLPCAPGIYAWFRTIRVAVNRGPDAFVDSLTEAIDAPAAPEWSARLGPMHRATLESRSELSPAKRRRLGVLAQDPAFRIYTARIVEAAAILQAPLYVGKAQDLQRRIRQHIEPMSELSTRLREAGIRIEECTLAYALLSTDIQELDGWSQEPQDLILIEEIVTRICRPGFVVRPG